MKFLLFPVMARKNLLQQCPHEHRTRQQCMISASHQSSNHNAVVAETTVAKLPTFKKHPFNFRNGKLFLSTTACKAKTAGEAKGRWANTTSTIFCIEVSVSPLLDWNNRSTPCSQPRHDGNTMGRAALNIAAHKWVPKGRRRGGTQTEMGGYLEHRNAQLCSVLPLLSSALAEASHSLSSSAQHHTRAFANKKGCSGSLQCPTAALQSSSGGHLLSRWPMKRFMFSFTPALFSWDVAHCQAGVALISGRDILRCGT